MVENQHKNYMSLFEMVDDSDSSGDDNKESKEKEFSDVEKENCRVFILSFILQYLLILEPVTPQAPKIILGNESDDDEVDSMKEDERGQGDDEEEHEPNTSSNGNNTTNRKAKRSKSAAANSAVSKKDKANKTTTPTFHCNFYRLQEAARMECTRSMEFLTQALLRCDKSVLSLANHDNFFQLVAYQRGTEMLKKASNFNIPFKHTYLDYVRFEENSNVRARQTWDETTSFTPREPVSSFARLQFQPKRASGPQDKVAKWFQGISLVEFLLKDVCEHVHKGHIILTSLREINDSLFFWTWNERETQNDTNITNIQRDYSFIYDAYKNATRSHPLLQRQEETLQNLETPTISQSADKLSSIDNHPEEYTRLCMREVKALVQSKYAYDLRKQLLFLGVADEEDLEISSFTTKTKQFVELLQSFIQHLVRKNHQSILVNPLTNQFITRIISKIFIKTNRNKP